LCAAASTLGEMPVRCRVGIATHDHSRRSRRGRDGAGRKHRR
jgi:hypothetical protein